MRIDFYTQVHKLQRKQLFLLSIKAGETNYNNIEETSILINEITQIIADLHKHAYHEETFIHPLLQKKIARSARLLNDDHAMLDKELQALEITLQHLNSLPTIYPKRQEQGLRLYRTFNQFIAIYLEHIMREECVLQELWEVTVNAELAGMMAAFQVYSDIEKSKIWLEATLATLNNAEQLLLFKTVQLMVAEPLFINLCKVAAEVLANDDWQLIQHELVLP